MPVITAVWEVEISSTLSKKFTRSYLNQQSKCVNAYLYPSYVGLIDKSILIPAMQKLKILPKKNY
jgi:hypothetical protein